MEHIERQRLRDGRLYGASPGRARRADHPSRKLRPQRLQPAQRYSFAEAVQKRSI